ncbi:MAG TPA: M23 family metallopeptidase [Hyphomicrobium sp.]|nr:M23 family metallopeptidase [Hyphomicrobium sp.]
MRAVFAIAAIFAGLAIATQPQAIAAGCEMAATAQEALAFARPTGGSAIKEFGDQYDEISKTRQFHAGVDLDGPQGEPVYAARSGKVVEAANKGDLGLYVRIAHGGGVETGYGHLSALSVVAGECVTGGRQIGKIGATGRTQGPRLHFEVLRDGNPINPLDFLQ